ncbi:MAG: tRNA dihydrouridine synthase DusB [Treponema sp.]|nr:tRNA dihydrouridine synthase DusB [Treponema sp.]
MNLYRPVTIGSLALEGNLFLAPVAGYSDRSFRSLCIEQGAHFSFTELVSAEALYRNPAHYGLGNGKAAPAAVSLVSRASNERRYAIQLFAGDPEAIYKAALVLAPLKPDAVDINAGCPVPKVVKNGAGSALMKDPARLGSIVAAAVKASREALGNVPVTIKMRSGWDLGSINYAECARIAVESGAAMITLHPRTRAQNYSGKSDWSHIADLTSRLSVPVTGSGDLYTPEDAQRMLQETGCAALMFARGAMGNPFIFSAARALLENGAWEPVSFTARMAAAFRHLELLAADIGEHTACLEMRKQFCAYTKGLKGGAAVREQAVHAETIADYRTILDTFNTNLYA